MISYKLIAESAPVLRSGFRDKRVTAVITVYTKAKQSGKLNRGMGLANISAGMPLPDSGCAAQAGYRKFRNTDY